MIDDLPGGRLCAGRESRRHVIHDRAIIRAEAHRNALVELRPFLRSPTRLIKGLGERWHRPIGATLDRGSFNDWPRAPYEFGGGLAERD